MIVGLYVIRTLQTVIVGWWCLLLNINAQSYEFLTMAMDNGKNSRISVKVKMKTLIRLQSWRQWNWRSILVISIYRVSNIIKWVNQLQIGNSIDVSKLLVKALVICICAKALFARTSAKWRKGRKEWVAEFYSLQNPKKGMHQTKEKDGKDRKMCIVIGFCFT